MASCKLTTHDTYPIHREARRRGEFPQHWAHAPFHSPLKRHKGRGRLGKRHTILLLNYFRCVPGLVPIRAIPSCAESCALLVLCGKVNPGILFPCTCVVPVCVPVPCPVCAEGLRVKVRGGRRFAVALPLAWKFFPRRTTQIVLGVMWRHANCNGQIDVCVSGRPQLRQRLLKLGVKSGRSDGRPTRECRRCAVPRCVCVAALAGHSRVYVCMCVYHG